MTDEESTIQEVLDLNERLLQSIAKGDWETYQQLCDPTLTAFEAESRGQLVEGMEFHRFYFDRGGVKGGYNLTVWLPTCGCWAAWPWSATCGCNKCRMMPARR